MKHLLPILLVLAMVGCREKTQMQMVEYNITLNPSRRILWDSAYENSPAYRKWLDSSIHAYGLDTSHMFDEDLFIDLGPDTTTFIKSDLIRTYTPFY